MCQEGNNVVLRVGIKCAKVEKLHFLPEIDLTEAMGATFVLESDKSKTIHLPLTTDEQLSLLSEHYNNLVLEIKIGEENVLT